jgi:GNAT superfamily N-acetyltransferase
MRPPIPAASEALSVNAVRPMRAADLSIACDISGDATKRFLDIDDPRIASCPDLPFTVDDLRPYVEAGRAWVATADDDVVGFVIVKVLDGLPHIEEIDVALAAGRRGHGSRLLEAVNAWAIDQRAPAITLTTFRDVPWNRPWYEQHGYRVLLEEKLTPELATQRDHEDQEGLPSDLRVVMRRDLP